MYLDSSLCKKDASCSNSAVDTDDNITYDVNFLNWRHIFKVSIRHFGQLFKSVQNWSSLSAFLNMGDFFDEDEDDQYQS